MHSIGTIHFREYTDIGRVNMDQTHALCVRVFGEFPPNRIVTHDELIKRLDGDHEVYIVTAHDSAHDDEHIGVFIMHGSRYISRYLHIWITGIDSRYRSRGVGSVMYDMVEKHAQTLGALGVTISTNSTFPAQLRILSKRGYMHYETGPSSVTGLAKMKFSLTF